MRKFRDKKSGIVFSVNTNSIISQFIANKEYEEIIETKKEKTTDNSENKESSETKNKKNNK